MKKLLLFAGIVGTAFTFNSCKKGENDPALSLSSRNSRLAGTWKLIDGTSTSVDYDANNQETWTVSRVYTDANYTSTSTFQDAGGTTTNPANTVNYTLEYIFEKDGAFTATEIVNGNSEIDKGFWYWGGKSKVQELKKKETVVISITESNDGNVDYYGGTAVPAGTSFQLDRLTGKELTIIVDMKNTYSDSDTYSYTATFNFEKQ